MPIDSITRKTTVDGTRWEDGELQGVILEMPRMLSETDAGLTNAIALHQIATTKQNGVVEGGLEVTPNPSGVGGAIFIDVGYAILPDGSVLAVEDTGITKTGITSSNNGDYIILRRSAAYSNDMPTRFTNVADVPTLRKYQVSAEILPPGSQQTNDIIVYTITTCDGSGIINGNTADTPYYKPELGPASGIDPEYVDDAQPENDMVDYDSLPTDLQTELDRLKSRFNYVLHKGNPYFGGWVDDPGDTNPNPPTGVSYSIRALSSLQHQSYNPVTMSATSAFVRLYWTAPATITGIPNPDIYEIKTVILQEVGGIDQEVSYTEKYYRTTDDSVEYILTDLQPGIKYRINIRSIHDTVLGEAYSSWTSDLDILIHETTEPTLSPGGSLVVTGIRRGFSLSWSPIIDASGYLITMSTGGAPTISNELARTSLSDYSFTTDTSALLHQFKIYAIDKLGQVISTIYYSGSGYQDLTEKIVLVGSSAEQAGECFTGTTGDSTKIHVEDIKKAVGAVGDFVTTQNASNFSTALEEYIRTEVFSRTKYPIVKTDAIQPANTVTMTTNMQAHEYFTWPVRIQNIIITVKNNSTPIESNTYLTVKKNSDVLLNLLVSSAGGETEYSWTNPDQSDYSTAYDFYAGDHLYIQYHRASGGSAYAFITIYVTPLFD
jgi:hypothetical protein